MYKILLLVIFVLLLSSCVNSQDDLSSNSTELEFDDSVITDCVVNNECEYNTTRKPWIGRII